MSSVIVQNGNFLCILARSQNKKKKCRTDRIAWEITSQNAQFIYNNPRRPKKKSERRKHEEKREISMRDKEWRIAVSQRSTRRCEMDVEKEKKWKNKVSFREVVKSCRRWKKKSSIEWKFNNELKNKKKYPVTVNYRVKKRKERHKVSSRKKEFFT